VRMYGQGLGDCFLLAFPRAGAPPEARPVYVVIDCGVIGGTPDGPARMKRIVEDIKLTTLDPDLTRERGQPTGHIDVLAITHEHWDHLSGFVQAEDEWKQIEVDQIWTAWTEKDEPGLPEVLRKIIAKQQQALAQIADRAARFGLSDQHETVLGLMSFLSDAPAEGLAFGASEVKGTSEAFDIAKGLARAKVFCEPGEVRRVPGTATDAYVLGPPRNDARLRQLDPTKKNPETYDDQEAGDKNQPAANATPGATQAGANGNAGFAPPDPSISLLSMAEGRSAFNAFALPLLGPALAAAPADPNADAGASALSPEEQDLYDRSFPFDRALRVPLPIAERAAQTEVPRDTATVTTDGSTTVMTAGLTNGATPDASADGSTKLYPALAAYFDELNAWRRIDFDWLAGSEAFALQADSLTNNTCLVLAFELPAPPAGGERKVLLFVGDAQVGNWLSWDEIERWQPIDGATPSQGTKPDITNLLERAALYKVGHHGSHNATLKARGVERMRAGKTLTAFVPTSPAVARIIKNWCHMPLDVLLNALAERTNNRVVLANGNVWPPIDDPAKLAAARQEIGVTVSETLLPEKLRASDRQQIEDKVPLWVQMAIPY
jgi:hypothetical protein